MFTLTVYSATYSNAYVWFVTTINYVQDTWVCVEPNFYSQPQNNLFTLEAYFTGQSVKFRITKYESYGDTPLESFLSCLDYGSYNGGFTFLNNLGVGAPTTIYSSLKSKYILRFSGQGVPPDYTFTYYRLYKLSTMGTFTINRISSTPMYQNIDVTIGGTTINLANFILDSSYSTSFPYVVNMPLNMVDELFLTDSNILVDGNVTMHIIYPTSFFSIEAYDISIILER